jgi:hypothetical protein
LLPVSVDALDGPERIWELATAFCDVGEIDLAIDQLDTLLGIPSQFSATWLKLAPQFLALHDHPRFQALLEKYR